MKRNLFAKEIVRAMLSVFMFIMIISVATIVNVSATDYRDETVNWIPWTNPPPNLTVGWITDKTMVSQKGGMPLFMMFYSNQGPEQAITCRATIQGYNSTTWVTGWRLDVLGFSEYKRAFSTGWGTDGGQGVWGTYTDYMTKTIPTQPTNLGRGFNIFIDIPGNTTQTSLTIRCNITDGGGITRYEDATLHIQSNRTYDIKLATTTFPTEIKPEESIEHPFTVSNLGNVTVDVDLSYGLSLKDSDGDAVSTTGWTLTFYNFYSQKINVYQNVGARKVVHPTFVITAPESEDAPAGSELTITIIGLVCNNTRYQHRVVLGGEDSTLSSDFEEDDEDDDDVDGAYGIVWFYWILLIIGIIVVILIFATPKFLRPKGKSGRKKVK